MVAISRAQKNVCGGGKTASDPAGLRSAINRRLLALSGISRSLALPPNRYDCQVFDVSRHASLEAASIEIFPSPASYL